MGREGLPRGTTEVDAPAEAGFAQAKVVITLIVARSRSLAGFDGDRAVGVAHRDGRQDGHRPDGRQGERAAVVPIGEVGTRVADRGMTYLLFFLAMISVNLAVLNFLPLPIVDGGLFLFLLYEGCFRRPPSVRFQNAATLVGLAFLGSLFVVTFYNDVVRLFTGG